jgi:4-hydroxy-2-oxoheptanedioate aldolase
MRKNNVREAWAAGKAVVNGWLAIPNSFSAETMAHAGWDSITIDMQHGIVDYQAAVTMLQAISTRDVTPLARVPWLEPGIIQKMLDAGTYGIICPMVNSRAECEAFVGACKYFPVGHRSVGPTRAALYGGPDYQKHANDTVLAIAMIETTEALANLDAILSTPGLDGVYVGPSDLSLTMGFEPKLDQEEPKVVEALGTIVDACERHGLSAGIHCGTPAYARKMIERGYRLVTIASDARIMAAAAKAAVDATRGAERAGTGGGGSQY